MAKYKVLDNISSTEGAKFFKGEVLEGTPKSDKSSFINVIRKNSFGNNNTLMEGFDLEKVDDSTPLTTPEEFAKLAKEGNKFDKTVSILSTIGALGGLYFAYSKKKGFWGYVGFMVLGGIAGSLAGNIVNGIRKKKTTSSSDNKAIAPNVKTPETTTSNTTKSTTSSADTSKLTKTQKIDLIIKNQSGGEEMDADEINNSKAFLNTLTDSDLNIWIPLSKALKDSEINSAMAKNLDNGFKLLETKYKITRKQAEEQMKKSFDFMSKALDSAGFKSSNFEGENGMFSNFESSLNLDL
jgi:hypothetical protein